MQIVSPCPWVPGGTEADVVGEDNVDDDLLGTRKT
jgi:hypothetical protein